MTERTTFSVRLGGGGGIQSAAEAARLAEEAGFDQVWTGNDFLGRSGIATMAAMIQATRTVQIGSAVFDPVTIHPGQLAQLAAGFQELSGDRFNLGIGAGSPHFFKMAGLQRGSALRNTREAVITVRELCEGRSPAAALGEGSEMRWSPQAHLEAPRPVRVYVGAMGPKMLDLAGRHADGALPLCLPPEQGLTALRQVSEAAVAAGRDPSELDIAACVWCSVGDSPEAARATMAEFIARYAGSLSTEVLTAHDLDPEEFARVQQLMDKGEVGRAVEMVRTSATMLRLGIVGDAMDVIAQCRALIDAGLRHVSFGPPLGPDPLRSLALLGERALPALR